MPNEAKQRFLDLVVEEVSIVDSPANECNYVVVKNLQEDGDMANTNTQQNAALKSSQAASTNTVSVNVESENNTEVIKAMQQVTAMVTSIAKSLEGAKNLDNVENDETKTEKSAAAQPAAAQPAAAQPAAAQPATTEGSGIDTQKNSTEQEQPDTFEETLKALGAVVEKAKRFTPKREAALKEIVDKLMALSKEMGMEEIPAGQSPSTSLPSSTSYSGTAITKSLEDLTAVVKSLSENMQQTAKSLGERISKVEGIRQPSQGEGDDNATTKVEKSMWAGIL